MYHRNPDLLTLDVGSARTRQELHALLSAAFLFPDYYGANWDAFDECIRDAELPRHVEITGLNALRDHLPREAELLQLAVADFAAECQHDITFPTT